MTTTQAGCLAATPSGVTWNFATGTSGSSHTLTTVGYGDIVPIHPIARSLSNLEGLLGQLYPAIILGRMRQMGW